MCSSFPHLLHMIIAGCSLLIFCVCALLNLGADFELSPLQRGLLSVSNAEVEMQVRACVCACARVRVCACARVRVCACV